MVGRNNAGHRYETVTLTGNGPKSSCISIVWKRLNSIVVVPAPTPTRLPLNASVLENVTTDVLFESASDIYGRALLGILLTGASPDGAAGLLSVHEHGGLTIVQAPDSCEAATMPQSALDLFEPHYVLAPSAIAALLATLTMENPSRRLP